MLIPSGKLPNVSMERPKQMNIIYIDAFLVNAVRKNYPPPPLLLIDFWKMQPGKLYPHPLHPTPPQVLPIDFRTMQPGKLYRPPHPHPHLKFSSSTLGQCSQESYIHLPLPTHPYPAPSPSHPKFSSSTRIEISLLSQPDRQEGVCTYLSTSSKASGPSSDLCFRAGGLLKLPLSVQKDRSPVCLSASNQGLRAPNPVSC